MVECYGAGVMKGSIQVAEIRMRAEIADRLCLPDRGSERLAELCRRCKVKQLDLFGSATRDDFDPDRSDLDFLAIFEDMKPAVYAKAYFDLREGLIELFGRSVDLMTSAGLRNPHLMRRVEAERISLYVG